VSRGRHERGQKVIPLFSPLDTRSGGRTVTFSAVEFDVLADALTDAVSYRDSVTDPGGRNAMRAKDYIALAALCGISLFDGEDPS
jgi:hypothetical protein